MAPVNLPQEETKSSLAPPLLDRSFFENALQKGYTDASLKIKKLHIREACEKGDNYTSKLHRVTVELEGSPQTRYSFIAKIVLTEGETAKLIRNSTAFAREIRMYTVILPKLTAILAEAISGEIEEFGPRCFYTHPTCLIMEDLSASGFSTAERRKGLNLTHCRLAMKTLAKFHAATFVLHEREPECMDIFMESIFLERPIMDAVEKIFANSVRGVAKEVETWPEYGQKYSKKLEKFADRIMEQLDIAARREERAFNVLTHGDLWVNNMMFRCDNEKLTGMRLIDYQLAQFTSPTLDLLYFLNTSPNLEVRQNHIDKLIQVYHETLTELLEAFGYNPKIITLQKLKEDFNNRMAHGLVAACTVMPIVVSEGGVDLDELLLEGQYNGTNTYKGKDFQAAIKLLLPLCDKHGVFDE